MLFRSLAYVKDGDKIFADAKGNPQGAEGMANVPAGQEEAVNPLDEMHWVQGVELPRAGCRSPNIDPAHGAFFAQQDGATGDGLEVGAVSDPYPFDVGDLSTHSLSWRAAGIGGDGTRFY